MILNTNFRKNVSFYSPLPTAYCYSLPPAAAPAPHNLFTRHSSFVNHKSSIVNRQSFPCPLEPGWRNPARSFGDQHLPKESLWDREGCALVGMPPAPAPTLEIPIPLRRGTEGDIKVPPGQNTTAWGNTPGTILGLLSCPLLVIFWLAVNDDLKRMLRS
jgi:hypothetical protein